MACVLVTGGTGFIGRHLIERLVKDGERVRCLIRSPDRKPATVPPGVEYALGDLGRDDSLDAALEDVETVYHLAATTLAARPDQYMQVNQQGTRRLADACARLSQPPVLVYVSSLAAAGPAPDGMPLTEESPSCPVSEYGRSKLAAEQSLREQSNRLPITILRPPSVFGPGDLYALKIFLMTRWGIAFLPGRKVFRLSWVSAEDLVEAMILAARQGQRMAPDHAGRGPGQGIYYVALDEQPSFLELANLAASVQGRSAVRTFRIPAFLCWLAAGFNDLRTRLTGKTYWLNTDKLREALAGSWVCSPDKAKRELGFSCRTDLAAGFRLTYEWYRHQGLL